MPVAPVHSVTALQLSLMLISVHMLLGWIASVHLFSILPRSFQYLHDYLLQLFVRRLVLLTAANAAVNPALAMAVAAALTASFMANVAQTSQ